MEHLSREEIINELSIADLPADAQDEIIGDVGHTLFIQIALAILERLPEDLQEEFKKLSLEHNGGEAEALAIQFIPNFDEFLANERYKALADFKRLLAA